LTRDFAPHKPSIRGLPVGVSHCGSLVPRSFFLSTHVGFSCSIPPCRKEQNGGLVQFPPRMFQGIPVSETALPQFVLHELSNQSDDRVSHLFVISFSRRRLSIKSVANRDGCSVGKFNNDGVNAVSGL